MGAVCLSVPTRAQTTPQYELNQRSMGQVQTSQQPPPHAQVSGTASGTQATSQSTIVVRGVDLSVSTEHVEMYFENSKRSGGGLVQSVIRDYGEGVIFLTFKDPQVSDSVVKRRGHRINGTEVTVSKGSLPPVLKDRVIVHNVPARLQELESLKPIVDKASNKRFQVQDIHFGEIDERHDTALIVFDQDVDFEKVRGFLSNEQMQVHEVCETKVVQVNNLPDDVSPELLLLYFENEKSRGGDVKCVNYIPGNTTAYITFDKAEDAQNVCSRKHVINKAVNVSLYHGHIAIPAAPLEMPGHSEARTSLKSRQNPGSPAESRVQSTVAVRGVDISISTDHVEMYFENNARSGGGPVQNVVRDYGQEVIFLTFVNSQDAISVTQRQDHKIGEAEVAASLQVLPPVMRDRVFIHHVPDPLQDSDILKMIAEKATNYKVRDIFFREIEGEYDTVLVVFNKQVDFEKVRATIYKENYPGLQIHMVCQTEVLQVKDLPDDVSAELLLLYFENSKKSGGDSLSYVSYIQEAGTAFVMFKSPDVAERVSTRKHVINNKAVSVSLYHGCRGTMTENAQIFPPKSRQIK